MASSYNNLRSYSFWHTAATITMGISKAAEVGDQTLAEIGKALQISLRAST